ncbi:MAG: hypothetical protein ACUVQP_11225, partial [Bacteroidales bacterium]
DELYYIYYKFKDETISKHRIIPKNAADGIWINPYISDPSNNYYEQQVKAILFKCSNKSLMKDDILVTFEKFSFTNNEIINNNNYINIFFNKNTYKNDSVIISSNYTFEKYDKHWAEIDTNNLSNDAYTGEYSFILKPNSFSSTYIIPFETLPSGDIIISANCWVKSNKIVQDIVLVISTENSNNNIWEGEYIKNQMVDTEWNNIANRLEYNISANDKGEIRIYLWNNSKDEILIDDFSIKIEHKLSH